MKTKNQHLIDQLNVKRGERKQFIVVYIICAVVCFAAAIFFGCMKEWSAVFACISMGCLCMNNATSQKECLESDECLITALEVIDALGEKAGIDLDEEQDPAEQTLNQTF